MNRRLRAVACLVGGIVAVAIMGRATADGPSRIYPEPGPEGNTRTVGAWANGSYTFAIAEYPEARPDGTEVYVWVWDNGAISVLLGEYTEAAPDGSVRLVRQWEDGTYTAELVAPPTVQSPSAAGPQPPPPPRAVRVCQYTNHPAAETRTGPVTPSSPVIKGNVSFTTGERIYHVPGGEFYGPTVISESYWERWFCTEDEARSAGWRRSLR